MTAAPNTPSQEYAVLVEKNGPFSAAQINEMGWHPKAAIMTDEHSASSYGLPVLLVDSVPCGPAESVYPLISTVVLMPVADAAGEEFFRASRRAGYNVQYQEIED